MMSEIYIMTLRVIAPHDLIMWGIMEDNELI